MTVISSSPLITCGKLLYVLIACFSGREFVRGAVPWAVDGILGRMKGFGVQGLGSVILFKI